MLIWAKAYAKAGWPVFPVGTDKKPMTKHGFEDATVHEGLIDEHWRQHPDANVALGIPEGLVVLDFDPRNGAPSPSVFQWGVSPPMTVRTPSGGCHLYFTVPRGVELVGKWMPGIDVKAGGKGYVLLPPSRTDAGEYAWEFGGFVVREGWPPPLPQWILTALTKRELSLDFASATTTSEATFPWDLGTRYGQFGLEQQLGFLSMAQNGERNNRLNRVGYRVGQLVAGGELKEAALHEVARVAEWVGLDKDEIVITLRSAYEAGLRKPWVR